MSSVSADAMPIAAASPALSPALPPVPDATSNDGSQAAQIRGIGRQTLVYGLGIVLSKAVAFLMLPVYTRFLTPGDYGVMELIEMTLDVISIIAGGRIALGIFRYYHKAETSQEQHAVISTALLTLAASYTLVAIMAFSAAGWLSELIFRTPTYAPLIRIAAGSLAFQSLLVAPLAYIRVQQRPGTFVIANFVKLVLSLSFNIYFVVHLHLGAKGVLLSNLISSAVVGTVLGIYVVRQVGFGWAPGALNDLLRYGLPLIGTQFATFIATFGDRYFLQRATDVTTVGVYTLAYQFGFMLGTLGYMPFELVWDPMRFAVAKRADRDEIFARAFVYLNLVLLSFAVLIVLFIRDLLHIMTTPGFYGAAGLVPVILIAYVLQGWTSMQYTGIYVRERTEFVTLGAWLSAATAIAGYALLIPRFHALGAAVATVLAFAVHYGSCFYASQRLWPIRYRWRPVFRQLAIGGVICAAGLILVPSDNLILSTGLHAALFVVYLVALWHGGVLTATERVLVRQWLRRAVVSTIPVRMRREMA